MSELNLLNAIVAASDPTAASLIYADWLDEQGESDAAQSYRECRMPRSGALCRLAELAGEGLRRFSLVKDPVDATHFEIQEPTGHAVNSADWLLAPPTVYASVERSFNMARRLASRVTHLCDSSIDLYLYRHPMHGPTILRRMLPYDAPMVESSHAGYASPLRIEAPAFRAGWRFSFVIEVAGAWLRNPDADDSTTPDPRPTTTFL